MHPLRPRPKTRSFRRVLIDAFMLAAIIPAFLLTGIVLLQSVNERRSHALAGIIDATTALRHEIERYLTDHFTQVQLLAASLPEVGRASGAHHKDLTRLILERHRNAYSGFLNLTVTDERGQVVALVASAGLDQDPQALIGHSVADRAYFSEPQRSGRPFISDAFIGRGLGRDVIVAVSAPMVDADGAFSGVVAGSLHLGAFTGLTQAFTESERTQVFIVDRRQRLVHAGGASALDRLASLAQAPMVQALASGASWTRYRQPLGADQTAPYLVARQQILPYGWQVYVRSPDTALLDVMAGQLPLFSLWLMGIFIGIGLVARQLARWAAQPVQRLLRHVRSLDPEVVEWMPIPALRTDGMSWEFAELVESFDDLSRRLGGTLTRLREARDNEADLRHNLEQVLAERDAEIQRQTQTLRQQRGQLRAALDAAQAANQAKSDFLANVSHEIRTPLNGVIGLGRVLSNTTLSSTQRRHLNQILTASQSLLAIINDLLDFSKMEAGRLSLEATHVNLVDLIDQAVASIAPRAEDKGLELVTDIDPNLPQQLMGDPLRIGQILSNLCSNAVKFTDAGEIILRAHATSTADARARLTLAVEDTGVGLSTASQAEIFKPFEQADRSVTRKYGGTGLGLTIAKRLCEQMAGTLTVDSTPGLGSTFTATLTLDHAPGGSEAPAAATASALTGRRLLVVHPPSTACDVLTKALKGLGATVDLIHTPEAMVGDRAMWDVHAYDAILVDRHTTGCDGCDLARALAPERRANGTPKVALLVGFGGEAAMCPGGDSPIDAIIAKPVHPANLRAAFASLFGPAADGAPTPAHTPTQATGVAGLTVLLVEDNPINQEVAVTLLTQTGVTVDVANDGIEALDRLRQAPDRYQAILMDIQMPNMDGLTATRHITADPTLAPIPVIAMTAQAMAADRERALAAGAVAHLPKPYDEATVLRALARHARPAPAARPFARAGAGPIAESVDVAPPEATTGTLALERLRTVDTRWLIQYLGSPATAAHLIQRLRDDHRASAEDIRAALDRGDRAHAQGLTHQLKGVTGNLRAHAAFRAAEHLDTLLRADSGARDTAIERALAALEQALAALFDDIDRAQHPAAPPAAPAIIDAATPAPTATLAHLRTLLDQHDLAAADAARAVRAGADIPPERAHALDQAIDRLDYDQARALLDGFIDPPGHGPGTAQ